jgi:hypothetical protein
VLLQDPPHDIPRHFVIGLLQVNKDHMQVFLLLPPTCNISLLKSYYVFLCSALSVLETRFILVISTNFEHMQLRFSFVLDFLK